MSVSGTCRRFPAPVVVFQHLLSFYSTCCRTKPLRGGRSAGKASGPDKQRSRWSPGDWAPPSFPGAQKETTVETTIEQLRQDLTLKGYAKGTCASYLRTVRQFQQQFGRPIPQITREEVRQFVAEILAREGSSSAKRMDLAALAFLYRKTLGRPDMVSFISWPTTPSPLPTVLSMEEVDALLHAIDHPVYQAIAVILLRDRAQGQRGACPGGEGYRRSAQGPSCSSRQGKQATRGESLPLTV